MKKISELPRPLRILLTLSWRILAVCILFALFYNMKVGCLRIMANNPYMRNVSGFWENKMLMQAVFYLSFLMYSSLSFVFKLHDVPYRRRISSDCSANSSLKTQYKAIFLGCEFWIEAAILSLWVLFSASDVHFFDLVSGFYADLSVSEAHWLTCGIMLPAILLLTVLAHMAAVSWWARKPEPTDITVRCRIFTFFKQLLFTCIMYLLLAMALVPVYPILATIGKVMNIHPLLFLIPLGITLIAILSFRYIRALLARHRFVHGLTRICHSERHKLTDRAHLYSSVFSAKDGINFHLTTEKGDYACKLICSLRHKTPLIFDEDGNVSYTVSYGLFGLDFFSDTISARYDFESNDKKILILSPAVDSVYITDGKARRLLESGDHFMGYTLYDGESLLNALRRKGL